jgi:hypothetical protein
VTDAEQSMPHIAAMIYFDGSEGRSKGFFPIDANGTMLALKEFTLSDVQKYFQIYAKAIEPPTNVGMAFTDGRIKQVLPLLSELEPLRKKLKLERIIVGTNFDVRIKIETSDQRSIDWGHAPGHEVPGEPTTSEKVNKLLKWAPNTTSDKIDLTVPDSGSSVDLPPVEPSPGISSALASEPKAISVSTISSKAVIEAAYAYEEALDNFIETKKLVAKGVISSRELSSSKRNAAAAKAIWASVCRDIAAKKEILETEIAGKQPLLHENNTRARGAEIELEFVKLTTELRSLVETQSWAAEFKKQSIDVLEKQFEQNEENKTEPKKTEAPTEPIAN